MKHVRFSFGFLIFASTFSIQPALLGQTALDNGYTFSAHCFAPPTSVHNGVIVVIPKNPLPPDCQTIVTGALTPAAITVVYSRDAVDKLVADLRAEINDLTTKSTQAIADSVKNNSVKSGEVDALVKTIQERLYQDTLRRVKADLAKSATAEKPTKATQ